MSSKAKFALSMIVKDVSHEIGRILDTADQYFDEVVVVDTGSTDGTQQLIADRYPYVKLSSAVVEPFDFSNARNIALNRLSDDVDVWMWLDSDDTFTPEVAEQWRRLADDLHNKPVNDPVNYIVLPYIYRVDEHDVPVVVQYRERIIRGTKDWEWREPLHEVCHYIGKNDSTHVAYAEFPVVHRPSRRPEESAIRNWMVLYRHYHEGDRSDRTLYYLMRTANVEGNHELALTYALPLVERKPGGYYEYEGLKGVGEAYFGLFNKTQQDFYADQGIAYLTQAIRFEPQRNEARATIIDLHLARGDAQQALTHAKALNVGLPKMIATLATEQYGTYRAAILALIYFTYMDQPYTALEHHMQAMNCARPHVTTFQLEKSIRTYIEDNNIGVIYADEAFGGQALFIREYLRKKGTFAEVWAYNDPNAVAYARDVYFHLTERPETLYQNDGALRLRKFYLDPHLPYEFSPEQIPIGYEAVAVLSNSPNVLDSDLDRLLTDTTTTRFTTAAEIVEQAKRCRTPKLWLLSDKMTVYTALQESTDLMRGRVEFFYDKTGNILYVAGWTEDIAAMYVDSKGILRVPSDNHYATQIYNEMSAEVPLEPMLRIEKTPKPKGTIVFTAPGIEDWDGTTPYRWGIGASESGVVYLANQFAQDGYDVKVYTTVAHTRLINGVLYIPQNLFKPDMKPWDLLIASRSPEALHGARKAKRQVLWMHDVPDAYIHRITDDMVIDKYVNVSDWQKDRAAMLNYRQQKLTVIPNGVYQHPRADQENTTMVKGRTVWTSQPERGVENLYGFWQKAPELFSDVWVAYGFYNITRYGHQDAEKTFLDVAYWKQVLKTMGAKLLGRIPNHQVERLLDTADRWVYPSKFLETFCVSGLEAFKAGVNCFVVGNGATYHTLSQAQPEEMFDRLEPTKLIGRFEAFMGADFDYNRDTARWLECIDRDNKLTYTRYHRKVNDVFLWPNVAKRWENEFING